MATLSFFFFDHLKSNSSCHFKFDPEALLMVVMEYPWSIIKVAKETTLSLWVPLLFVSRIVSLFWRFPFSLGWMGNYIWFHHNILICEMQVMDMLGPSLWDVWNSNSQMYVIKYQKLINFPLLICSWLCWFSILASYSFLLFLGCLTRWFPV